jgi:hypothetical protein
MINNSREKNENLENFGSSDQKIGRAIFPSLLILLFSPE